MITSLNRHLKHHVIIYLSYGQSFLYCAINHCTELGGNKFTDIYLGHSYAGIELGCLDIRHALAVTFCFTPFVGEILNCILKRDTYIHIIIHAYIREMRGYNKV